MGVDLHLESLLNALSPEVKVAQTEFSAQAMQNALDASSELARRRSALRPIPIETSGILPRPPTMKNSQTKPTRFARFYESVSAELQQRRAALANRRASFSQLQKHVPDKSP